MLRAVYDADGRRGRPGVHRGRPAQGPRHRGDHRRGQRPVVAGRPPEPLRQDPGHARGAARDHRGPRRRHQRQRHADLLPGALPRGDGRLPDRPGAGGRRAASTSASIASVASFFVSRVDTEIDKRLEKIGTPEALALRGQGRRSPTPGWPTRRTSRSSPPTAGARWPPAARGCSARCGRRPGVKDPAYRDTLYVDDLVAPDTVNTMPEKTLDAVVDHGAITGDTVRPYYGAAHADVRVAGGRGHRHARRRPGARGRGRRQVRQRRGASLARVAEGRARRGDHGA